MQAASTRNEEVDFVLQLQHIMAGRPDRNRSIQEVLTPVLQRHPTCSLAIFATLFCAVARRLSSPYRITCEPSNDPKFVELVVSSDSILSFDLVRGGLKVTTQDEIEKLPTRSRPLSPCVMVRAVCSRDGAMNAVTYIAVSTASSIHRPARSSDFFRLGCRSLCRHCLSDKLRRATRACTCDSILPSAGSGNSQFSRRDQACAHFGVLLPT